jgi:hypothetical protein
VERLADVTYLLPIASIEAPSDELTDHLREVAERCRVLIVDGSPDEVFALAHAAWAPWACHVRPDPRHACAMGKVQGVLTGLDLVDTDVVIIADDDVRYTPAALDAVVGALGRADVVVPQNHFDPLPWHAVWDTGRILLNRVSGGDYPGTLGVRTDSLRAAGGYDGDVMFENLELIRTVEAAGGTTRRLDDTYVRRLPPTTRHFLGQRVRQAYDELARPARLAVQLAVLPTLAVMVLRRPRWLVGAGAAIVAAAELGRRRGGGRAWFPWLASVLAPAWVLERGVCAWIAVGARARGGIRYRGGRIACAGHTRRQLRARQAAISVAG